MGHSSCVGIETHRVTALASVLSGRSAMEFERTMIRNIHDC